MILCAGVFRTTTSFRHSPINILKWILNITSLAMYTVLCIDLELGLASLILDVFVDTGRAESGLDAGEGGEGAADLEGWVGEAEMDWLVFFVVGAGSGDVL